MKRMVPIPTLTGAFLAVLLLLAAGDVQAQRSNTRGIFLNAHLSGTSMGFDNDAFNTQSGGVILQNVIDINATSGRFTVGLSWFPSRR